MQASWMYLEPIFGSEDILEQMPKEGGLFHQNDKVWRRIMAAAEKCDIMLDVRAEASGFLDKRFGACLSDLSA